MNGLIGLAALLWSIPIGPEEIPRGQPQAPVATEAPASGREGLKKFRPVRYRSIDRAAFQAAFRRQAADQLLGCLKSWRPSPDAIVVSAVLSADGHLDKVISLETQKTLPDCSVRLIEQMDFSHLSASLEGETQTLQWRIEW